MEKRTELIWAQQGQMDEGQFMQEHCHGCYQIYYILKGTATFVLDSEIFKVSSGDFFIVPEMMTHSMFPLKREVLHYYEMKLHVNDVFLKEHLKTAPKPIKDSGVIKNMLCYIVENWTCHDEQNKKDTEYIMTTLLLNFFIEDIHYEHKDSVHILTDGYSDVTRAVLVYIEKYFSYKFSLETLGKRLSYNKNYLCYVFKKDAGASIVDYLNFIRIRRAIIFFAFYSQDVYTTCESVGFSNLSHFSRTFKSLVGLAPRDFRRAFSLVGQQETAKYFTNEMILNYQLCTMDDALKSLNSIGMRAKDILDSI